MEEKKKYYRHTFIYKVPTKYSNPQECVQYSTLNWDEFSKGDSIIFIATEEVEL